MLNLEGLIELMKGCEQTTGQSVYEHGLSVLEYFKDWNDGEYKKEWKKPSWFEKIDPIDIHGVVEVIEYIVFHDCGKPLCQIVEDGVRHFPNHSKVSAETYFALTRDALVSKLIENDMVLHSASAEEISDKLKNEWSKRDALTLLIVALCEIHSNANLFGGIESTSFKIKWKNLDRRGKQVLKYFD